MFLVGAYWAWRGWDKVTESVGGRKLQLVFCCSTEDECGKERSEGLRAAYQVFWQGFLWVSMGDCLSWGLG